jgi:NDP-sugar pyrophosphorylase family protein
MSVTEFKGLPVVPFEKLEKIYSPSEYLFFAPITGTKMNNNRKRIYEEGKKKGYTYISYISSKATICGNKIGENCFILEDNTLQPFTEIGNNVVMWSGNHIGHHGKIEDHVFFNNRVELLELQLITAFFACRNVEIAGVSGGNEADKLAILLFCHGGNSLSKGSKTISK